jgi:hypothetical protein
MNHHSTFGHVLGQCRPLLPLFASVAIAVAAPVVAQPGPPGMTHTAAPLESPVQPGNATSDTLIVMVCRPGIDPDASLQAVPQELPLVCLVTETDAQTLQMGPARFQELLDRAADSGTLTVMVLRPQR